MKTVLFQGDSITDAGRDRQDKRPNVGLGNGYVTMVAGQLLTENPHLHVYNRGVSGNRVGDCYARWREDTLQLHPDLLSVLLGVNDVGFTLRLGCGAPPEEFFTVYNHMLDLATRDNPALRLVLCQPYVLRVDNDWPPYGNDIYRDFDRWDAAVREMADRVEALSRKWGATYVRFQDALDEAQKQAPAQTFSYDAIHPNAAGCGVLARAWLAAVGQV